MKAPITDRQKQVLDFIRDYIEANEVSPTLRDIGEHFGVSVPAAARHVKSLVKKGWITRTTARQSIQLLT